MLCNLLILFRKLIICVLFWCVFQEDEVTASEDIEKLGTKLRETQKVLDDKSRQYHEVYDDFKKSSQEITIKRQSLEAFGEAINLFREQIKTQEKFQREAQPHEIKG